MTKVFVYGTLKRAYWNTGIMGQDTFLMSTRTATPEYDIKANGIPYMGKGNFYVKGEVFEVDDVTLARLDRLEGHPRNYLRSTLRVEGLNEEVFYYDGSRFMQNAGDREIVVEGDTKEWRPRG
jgi:gamma-glutamylaminecyclotransferase